jgi:hypothetical protein
MRVRIAGTPSAFFSIHSSRSPPAKQKQAGGRLSELKQHQQCGGLPGTTRRKKLMFIDRKNHSPALFMKFGVDDQGFVIPFLRRGKSPLPQENTGLKTIPIRRKLALRLRG